MARMARAPGPGLAHWPRCVERKEKKQENLGQGGKLAPIAASVPMRVSYAARMARFDLLRITCKLATRVTKWDCDDDKRLMKLMRYIHSTLTCRQVGYLGVT